MKKIICDVCGTSYQESADCCPICGCTREEAIMLGEEFSMDDASIRGNSRGGQFSAKKKAIFDFDEVNAESEDDTVQEVHYYDDEEPVAPQPRYNTFAVVVLTVLIAVLLLMAGFLFLRYLLPNQAQQETVVTTAPQIQQTTQEPQTISVPCESLALTSGTAQLSTEGAFFLINVSVYPEDTTDQLIYHSADSSIATVDDTGRITAVAQGKTVVYITCGTQQIPCEVVCDFTPETVEATEQTIPEESAAETVAETVPETTVQTEPETTEAEVVLKLAQSEFWLYIGQRHTLKLDCDLAPEDVEWSVEHPWIADVDENGLVTAKSKGVTEIIASYGEQTVSCTVRCKVRE